LKKLYEATIIAHIEGEEKRFFNLISNPIEMEHFIEFPYAILAPDEKGARIIVKSSDVWKNENIRQVIDSQYNFKGKANYKIEIKTLIVTEIASASLFYLIDRMRIKDFLEYAGELLKDIKDSESQIALDK
jgi:hypothetical protein